MIDLEAEGGPVSPRDLAEVLGVTPRYIRKLIAAGALDAVRLPSAGDKGRDDLGRFRIPRAAARALLARNVGNNGNSRAQTVDNSDRAADLARI